MAGHTDPPEGAPGGVPGPGDEEYQSTLFDEAFVRAARLQEYSARERLEDHTSAVRRRPAQLPPSRARTVPRQGLALALVILLAFAAAIYLGGSNPYDTPQSPPAGSPTVTLVPLAPEEEVPGARTADTLFAHSPARDFGAGAGGISLSGPRATAHFSAEQVLTALTVAKDYVVASALTPAVVTGDTIVPVRELLVAEQRQQLDRAVDSDTSRTPPTAWLVRFDPAEVTLADPRVRVDGTLTVTETTESTESTLEVVARHVVAYAVRPADDPDGPVALFTVRREVRMHFGELELRDRRAVVRQVEVQAGPMDCAVAPTVALRPLLAGETARRTGPVTTDPYAVDTDPQTACGRLAPTAQPTVPAS